MNGKKRVLGVGDEGWNDELTIDNRTEVFCPEWTFFSNEQALNFVGGKIKDIGNGKKIGEAWQPSQKAVSFETMAKLKRKINKGVLKPIDNWTFPTDSIEVMSKDIKRTRQIEETTYKQKHNNYYYDKQDKTVYLVLEVNSWRAVWDDIVMINGKGYRNGEYIAFPMEKADMFFEVDAEGNLIGVSGDYRAGIRYKDKEQYFEDYKKNFIQSQQIMNEYERKGLLKGSKITKEKEHRRRIYDRIKRRMESRDREIKDLQAKISRMERDSRRDRSHLKIIQERINREDDERE